MFNDWFYSILWLLGFAAGGIIFLIANKVNLKPSKGIKSFGKKPKVENDNVIWSLDKGRMLMEKHQLEIEDRATKSCVDRITDTIELITLEAEKDPLDRRKVRKFANHTLPMVQDLINSYIELEKRKKLGQQNVDETLIVIRLALLSVEDSLNSLLEDLFVNDNLEINANIEALEKLLQLDKNDNIIDLAALHKNEEI